MAPKPHRNGPTAQLRAHSRSSSASRVGGGLQLTQKDGVHTRGVEKNKKIPGHMQEAGRPGFPRANSSQRVPSSAQVKRTSSAVNTAQQQPQQPPKTNGAKTNAGFTLTRSVDGDEDEDEWVSSSGAQTPNKGESDSDTTASEGEQHQQIPRELLDQLQRTQLVQHQQQQQQQQHQNQNQNHQQATRAQAPLPRVDTARQSDFHAATPTDNAVPPKEAPPPIQTPFPTTNSDPNAPSDRNGHYVGSERHHQTPSQPQTPQTPTSLNRDVNHTRSDSRQTSYSSKRHSLPRPLSSHSMSGRPESILRPHPLIRGHSQSRFDSFSKPTPLAPLTVIADQPSGDPDNDVSTSPLSARTSVTSPGGFIEFPHERRSSVSSARSISVLPSQSATLPSRQHDRVRTLSAMSATVSSSALNSLTHLPSVTRPPSPQQISFFPPVNPHVNIEAIHPLLPAPYLNNHLTVLARRTPLRESYDRVIQAKLASGR